MCIGGFPLGGPAPGFQDVPSSGFQYMHRKGESLFTIVSSTMYTSLSINVSSEY